MFENYFGMCWQKILIPSIRNDPIPWDQSRMELYGNEQPVYIQQPRINQESDERNRAGYCCNGADSFFCINCVDSCCRSGKLFCNLKAFLIIIYVLIKIWFKHSSLAYVAMTEVVVTIVVNVMAAIAVVVIVGIVIVGIVIAVVSIAVVAIAEWQISKVFLNTSL